MTETADGEGTGEGRDLVRVHNKEVVHDQDGLSSLTEVAPETNITHIDDVLGLLPVSKQSQPPEIPAPVLGASPSDLLVKEKDLEEKPHLNLEANPNLLEAELKEMNPEPVRCRIEQLNNQTGGLHRQPRYRDLSGGWFRKMEAFVKKRRESWLTEVLSKETDVLFLYQLLDAIYSLDPVRVAMSPPVTKFDDIVDRLVASPSVLSRERTKELFAPIEL